MKTTHNIDKIEELIQRVTKLEIANKTIQEEIKEAKREIKKLETNKEIKNEDKRRHQEYLAYERSHTLEVGDKVIILNSTKKEEKEGTIIGVTPKGFVRIKTNTGKTIRRLPKNLRRK